MGKPPKKVEGFYGTGPAQVPLALTAGFQIGVEILPPYPGHNNDKITPSFVALNNRRHCRTVLREPCQRIEMLSRGARSRQKPDDSQVAFFGPRGAIEDFVSAVISGS